jgi:phosphotransferase system  glucose/maltose/N-acetylglucosamine-specific IIC component
LDINVLGYSIVVGSLFGLVVYFYLVFLSPWSYLVIRISAFLAVAACLLVVAWAGYTYATTPTEDLDLGELYEEEG